MLEIALVTALFLRHLVWVATGSHTKKAKKQW